MAIQVIAEDKFGGTYNAPTLTVYVRSDDGSALALDDAIDALNAEYGVNPKIPETVHDYPPDGNLGQQQTSRSSYRFTINYREPNRRNVRPVTGSEVRAVINAQAKSKLVRWAPEVAAYSGFGLIGGGSEFKGLVDVQFNGLLATSFGTVINPPEPNIEVEFSMPLADVTPTFRRTIATTYGCVNSASLSGGTYNAGEIFLCYVRLQRVSDTEASVSVGWNYTPNVDDEVRGDITGIDYKGHHYVWEAPMIVINEDRNLALPQPRLVIVNQVWPEKDLSVIGISPPT